MKTHLERGTLLLTAAGFFNPKVANCVIDLIKTPAMKKVIVITTAAEGKENNKYSQLAKEQLVEMGFNTVDFLDLETQGSDSVTNYDVIYVCGGNTFKLLKFARETNLKTAVIDVLDRGGLYIGVSAGSLLVGPSIKIASEVSPDKNEVGLNDPTGLDLVDIIIFPHYESKHEAEIKNFEMRNNVSVTRLTNNQAAVVRDGKVNIIE